MSEFIPAAKLDLSHFNICDVPETNGGTNSSPAVAPAACVSLCWEQFLHHVLCNRL